LAAGLFSFLFGLFDYIAHHPRVLSPLSLLCVIKKKKKKKKKKKNFDCGVFLLLFWCSYLRGRYDAVFVHTTLHPSNGFIFPVFFSCVTFCLLIMQVVTMIVLILYQLFLAPLLLIPICFTVFVFVLVQLQFGPISKYGTLSHAPECVVSFFFFFVLFFKQKQRVL
jgi:hypothetical protein